MSEEALDALLERIAREEEEELNHAHGAGILATWAEGHERKEEGTRLLLGAIARARMAQETKNEQG